MSKDFGHTFVKKHTNGQQIHEKKVGITNPEENAN